MLSLEPADGIGLLPLLDPGRVRGGGWLAPRTPGKRCIPVYPTEGVAMAELTQLEEKLAEVMGLAQAAKDSTAKVRKLVDDQEVVATCRDEKLRPGNRATVLPRNLGLDSARRAHQCVVLRLAPLHEPTDRPTERLVFGGHRTRCAVGRGMAVDHVRVVESEGARVLAAYRSNPDGRVPWSDRWTARSVARHVAGSHHAHRDRRRLDRVDGDRSVLDRWNELLPTS
jgi:hypothetical protein